MERYRALFELELVTGRIDLRCYRHQERQAKWVTFTDPYQPPNLTYPLYHWMPLCEECARNVAIALGKPDEV